MATRLGWGYRDRVTVEQRKTICNRDCPDTCGIVATVEDGRILRIQGDRDHPVTGGFLCHRTNQYLSLIHI